jgi:hypothetical protein
MARPLWQLLLEKSSDLNCDECFAVMEYYAELLAGGNPDLLPQILKHLEGCPNCELQHREALLRLAAAQSEGSAAPPADPTRSDGSDEKGQRRCWQERGKSLKEEPR